MLMSMSMSIYMPILNNLIGIPKQQYDVVIKGHKHLES